MTTATITVTGLTVGTNTVSANSLDPTHFTNPLESVLQNNSWTPAQTKYLAGPDANHFIIKSIGTFDARDAEVTTWSRNGVVFLRLDGTGKAIYFNHNGETTNGTLDVGIVTGLDETTYIPITHYSLYQNENLKGTVSGYHNGTDDTTGDTFTFGVSGFDIYLKFNGTEFARWKEYRHMASGAVAIKGNTNYGFRDITWTTFANSTLFSNYTSNELDLRDWGVRSLQTTGSISSGSNVLTLSSNPGFVVGDWVIVETGKESGGGLRGTAGVGGTWPSLSYADKTSMDADTSQPSFTLAYNRTDGTVYQFGGTVPGWLPGSVYNLNDRAAFGGINYQSLIDNNVGLEPDLNTGGAHPAWLSLGPPSGWTQQDQVLSFYVAKAIPYALHGQISSITGGGLVLTLMKQVAQFSGTASGTTISVSSLIAGTISIGQKIFGPGIPAGTTITGGSGTSWTVDKTCLTSGGLMSTMDVINASASVTGANVYLNNVPYVNRLTVNQQFDYYADLRAITPTGISIIFPTGTFAGAGSLIVSASDGWTIKGQGQTNTTLYAPFGSYPVHINANNIRNITFQDFTIQGNFTGDDKYGMAIAGWTVLPAGILPDGSTPSLMNPSEFGIYLSSTVIPQGSCYPGGISIDGGGLTGSVNGTMQDITVNDVFMQAFTASFAGDVWAYRCTNNEHARLRVYTQWQFQWANTFGGGCVDCTVNSLPPGAIRASFESFGATGHQMIRCTALNASFSQNTSGGWLIQDCVQTITANPSGTYPAAWDKNNPLFNINSNIGGSDTSAGGVIRNCTTTIQGYLNTDNDIPMGININAFNPNVLVDTYTYIAPNYAAPSTLSGPLGIHSTGVNTTVLNSKVVGTCKTPDGTINIANIGVLDGFVCNNSAGVITLGGTVKSCLGMKARLRTRLAV